MQLIHHPDDGGSMYLKTSDHSNETTRCYIPEDSKLHNIIYILYCQAKDGQT
jgi:hypothetical protein